MKIILTVLATALILAIGSISIAFRSPLEFKGGYSDLNQLPSSEFKNLDIALLNLICAEGLPGAESLNVDESVEILDTWAQLVKENESTYFYQYQRNPA